MNKSPGLILILALLWFGSIGQPINRAKLDSFMDRLDQRQLAMGTLVIAKKGQIVYQRSLGYARLESGQKFPTDTHSQYRIGSATKMFTAVMILQLAEEGRLSLDDKLAKYFPSLPNAEKISLRQMLYHRSGLHDYTHDTGFPDWMDQHKSPKELLGLIREKGADFKPGTDADYSNSNFLLLGYIIEQISKTSYPEALKKRITTPLGMNATHCGTSKTPAPGECLSYKYGGNQWDSVKGTDLSIHGGAGSIISTPTDMVRFMEALFSFQLISKASLAGMETLVDDYGMGIFANKYGSRPSFGHNGRIEEFYSALWYYPGQHLCLAYCTNGIDYPRTDLLEGVLKICFQEPFSLPFEKVPGSGRQDFTAFLGKYASEQLEVTCTTDSSRLLLSTRGKVFATEQVAANYFMNAESGYFFEFKPGEGLLLIKETDNSYTLKKKN